jgi:hypothetical protein
VRLSLGAPGKQATDVSVRVQNERQGKTTGEHQNESGAREQEKRVLRSREARDGREVFSARDVVKVEGGVCGGMFLSRRGIMEFLTT